MNGKILVVAKEKNLIAIQDILEAARRIGCEIRWLQEWEKAPSGSWTFYTKAAKGKWARFARQKIMITKSFNDCNFLQLVERVRNVIFSDHAHVSANATARASRQLSARIERLRALEIQKIRFRHSLLP